MPVQTLLFLCIKFVSRSIQCIVKILENFTEDIQENHKYRYENGKQRICLGIYNSTLKAKILTEMIVNQHIIIAYCI